MIDLPPNDAAAVIRAWLEERPTYVRNAPREYPWLAFVDFGINFFLTSSNTLSATQVIGNLWAGDMPVPANGAVSRAIADDLAHTVQVPSRGLFELK